METVILEHQFCGKQFDFDRYVEAQHKNQWCLELHGVRHVISYLSPNRQRMICVFEAPDAEALRRAARQLGYTYERIWPASIVASVPNSHAGAERNGFPLE